MLFKKHLNNENNLNNKPTTTREVLGSGWVKNKNYTYKF